MKTEVILKRNLFDEEISQKSKSGYFSASDLVKAGNKWRAKNNKELFNLTHFLRAKQTKEFIAEIEIKYGKAKINSKGKGHHTWVHPLLFIDIALAISPKLKIEVYDWLFDNLIKFRNESGDSYKKMAGALFENTTKKTHFYKEISVIAKKIQDACNVDDWQKANEKQLKLRDKIHENIALLTDVLKDNKQAVRIGIQKAIN